MPFPLGAPVKVCTTRLRGLRDSPYWQGCGCWSATLPLSSPSELLAEKSGLEGGFALADRLEGGRGSSSSSVSHAQYSPSWLSESITISRILFWDSGRARFARETAPRCILESSLTHLPRLTAKSQVSEHENLQGSWWKCFFPHLRTPTRLPVRHTIRVLSPKHSDPCAKCKTNLTAQFVFNTYATYAFMNN
jgi:hypothetical protein